MLTVAETFKVGPKHREGGEAGAAFPAVTRGAGRRRGVNLQLRLFGRELLPLALPSRLPWQLCLHGKGIPSPPRLTPVVGATQVRRSGFSFSHRPLRQRGGRRKQSGAVRCNAMFYRLHGLLPARANAWGDLSGGGASREWFARVRF